MSLTNLYFLPFVAGVVLLYYTVFRKIQWIWLLAASIAFYLFAGPKYIVYILASSAAAFFAARRMNAVNDEEDAALEQEGLDKEQKKAI